MQLFKNDEKEQKMVAVAEGLFDLKSSDLDDFYEGCYETFPFGDMLYDEDRTPLSNAIKKEIFRETFPEIFDAFIVAGSFESYISVFTKIFGEDVEIDFTVPAPGKLLIDIVATGLELSEFIARRIEDNAYIFDEIIDYDLDTIVFQTVKGFQTEYELKQMLYEMVPDGIYTEITLTIGS